jgi:3-oxoadipate enol-lactonase
MPLIASGNAQISYEVSGDGDPLVLIMGFNADARMWMMQLPAFASRFRCITVDNRGAGLSPLPADPFSMQDMAADVVGVLDHLGIERAHVVGISMGGAIAQHVALQAPERVRSLVLAATWCAPNPYTDRIAKLGTAIFEALGQDAIAQAFMLWLFTPNALINAPQLAEFAEKTMLEYFPPHATYLAQLAALLQHDTRDRIGSIAAPTLVMVGRRDILVPPELSQQIAALMPHAELKLLETGHAFNVEEADAFNATILDFLSKH